jgi:hypothetical protein
MVDSIVAQTSEAEDVTLSSKAHAATSSTLLQF